MPSRPTRRAVLGGAMGALTTAGLLTGPSARAMPPTALGLPGAPAGGYKILEIFFAGALSHRETLWVEQPDEAPVVRELDALDGADPDLAPAAAPGDWRSWLVPARTYRSAAYQLGMGSEGIIHLGPCGSPLVDGPAGLRLVDRLRVVATGHELPVHGPAQALMLQGLPASRDTARASGLAAAIGRASGQPGYVLYDSTLTDSVYSSALAAAVGHHVRAGGPPPVRLPFDNPDIVSLLAHGGGDDVRVALANVYNDAYVQRLTFGAASHAASGLRARSASLDEYLKSFVTATSVDPALGVALAPLTASTARTLWDNPSRRGIRAAVQLLRGDLTRYAAVMDSGVAGESFGGFSFYDTHQVASRRRHAAFTTGNALSVFRTVQEEVASGNLDLDTTLVVFNTEFGRAFADPNGTEHNHRGFAVAFLGGPIVAGATAVVGDLRFTPGDDSSALEQLNPATARGGATPTELRAAVLHAAGIHPFQSDVFRLDEVPASSSTPEGTASAISRHVFGL